MSDVTAGTVSSAGDSLSHRFVPDAYEPGYRPVCAVCRGEQARHVPAVVVPVPRAGEA